jgi:dihydropteroate synthase
MIIKQFPDAAIEKGKMVLDPGQGLVKKKEHEEDRNHGLKKWSRPGLGHFFNAKALRFDAMIEKKVICTSPLEDTPRHTTQPKKN